MLKNRLLALLSISVFSLALAACGDDDDDTSDTADTADIDGGPNDIDGGDDDIDGGGNALPDDETPMNELTPGEAQALCEANEEELETVGNNTSVLFCYGEALSDQNCTAEEEAACNDLLDDDSIDCAMQEENNCTGTVAQFLTCSEDGVAASSTVVDGINCANAFQRITSGTIPPSCTTFYETCPSKGGKPLRGAARP